jgi:multidrug efflux pump subunit AcrB
MKIFDYFLNRSQLVNLITVFVLILGVFSIKVMNRDLAPPLNFNRIVIEISYPESTAADLEQEITFRIEEKLMNFPNIKNISSTSSQGLVKVWVSFPANFKTTSQAANEIRQNVEALKPYLPQNIRSITVSEQKITSNFQNEILVRNFDLNNKDHRIWLLSLKNKISQIRGIAEIQDRSFPKRSVKIDLNEMQMKRLEVTPEIAKQKINDFLQFRPLGAIRRGLNFTFIEFEQSVEESFLKDLDNLVIYSSPAGYRTTLGQFAKVSYSYPFQDQHSYEDNKRVYYISIKKDLNSDIINLDEKIKKTLVEANKNKFGIEVKSVFSGKSFIERQLQTLKSNGILGVIIVFIFLVLFLSFKSAFFTILGVPFAYSATFMTMLIMGYDIDILSIVGLILVCGMLVDDALIMCEKYNECLEQGLAPLDSARQSINELFIPVFGSILTTVVAFLPLLLIPSELGNMISSIPVVLITALSFSLIESFFILPNHLAHFVKRPTQSIASRLFDRLRKKYENFLTFFLRWKISTSLIFLLSTGLLLYASMDVEKDFNLNISDDMVRIEGELISSDSKEETLSRIKDLYNDLEAAAPKNEFESVALSIGSVWRNGEQIVSDKVFRIYAQVKENYSQPEVAKNSYLKKVNTIVDKYKKDYKFLVANKSWSDDESDKSKYLTFNFYTKNTKQNLNLKATLETLPKKIKGIGPLDLGQDSSVGKWVFTPNYEIMAKYSIDKNSIQTAILGKVDESWLKEVRIEGQSYPVNFTINDSEITKKGFEPRQINVLTQNQRYIPLSDLGEWKYGLSPKSISHLNGYNVQSAKFKILDEKNRETIVKEAETYVKNIENQFPEHIIKASGESLQEAENKQWVLMAMFACVLGIFFVLTLALNSLSQPLIVSLPIPFAAAGVMWMHKLHDMPLGVFSMIGLIGAIGVSVNGTLIMSDQINLKLKECGSESLIQIVKSGSASRLRAIFLTTVTTLAGLFPMAYSLGGDSGFTRPLAFSMAWGIMFSALMTLVFFPSIYLCLISMVSALRRLTGKL